MRLLPSYLLLIKPPAAIVLLLIELRRAYGIATSYAAGKFHTTLLPLGHAPDRIGALIAALESFSAPPFRIVFDRIESTLLRPSEPIRGLDRFQRNLVGHLVRHGTGVPGYAFRPHISLSYGQHSSAMSSIDPVSWRVEEFLLIESHAAQHKLRGRWRLD
jgi:2'-5' RNA ligase